MNKTLKPIRERAALRILFLAAAVVFIFSLPSQEASAAAWYTAPSTSSSCGSIPQFTNAVADCTCLNTSNVATWCKRVIGGVTIDNDCEGSTGVACNFVGDWYNTQQCCCEPATCASLGKSCGSWWDGCSTTLSCGTCSGFGTCAPGCIDSYTVGTYNSLPCVPSCNSGTCGATCTPSPCGTATPSSCGTTSPTCGTRCTSDDGGQYCTYPSASACSNTCSGGVCSDCTASCGSESCDYTEGQCGWSCLRGFTVSNVDPSSQSIYPTGNLNYKFDVTTNDNSGCAAKSYTATLSLPSGWSSRWIVPAVAFPIGLNPGTTSRFEFQVTPPSSATIQTYSDPPSVSVTDGTTTTPKTFTTVVYQPTWISTGQIRGTCPVAKCYDRSCDTTITSSTFGACIATPVTCTYGCDPASGNCYSCPSGQTLCGSSCVDTLTDSSNCGLCTNACSPPDDTYSSNYCAGGNVVRDKTTYASACAGGSCVNTPSTTTETVTSCTYGCDASSATCYPFVPPTISISPKTTTADSDQTIVFTVATANPNPFSYDIKMNTPKLYDSGNTERVDWSGYIVRYADSSGADVNGQTLPFDLYSTKNSFLSIRVPPSSAAPVGSKVRVKAIAEAVPEGSLVDDTAEITIVDTIPPSLSLYGTPFAPCDTDQNLQPDPDPAKRWIDCSATAGISCSDSGSGCNPASYRFRTYPDSERPYVCPPLPSDYSSTPPQIGNATWVCGYAEDNVGNPSVSMMPARFLVNRTFEATVNARVSPVSSTPGIADIPAGTEVRGYLCEPSEYFCNQDAKYLASGANFSDADRNFIVSLWYEPLIRGQEYKIGIVTDKGYSESMFTA